MKIANIYTIQNQELYKDEEIVMILAHLMEHYDPTVFNNKQHIILDNGIYEGFQVSTDIKPIIEMAETSGIPVTEIVVPDKFYDTDTTIRYFEENIEAIREWSHKYQFMFVAHHANFEDFKRIMEYINNYDTTGLNISVGIPKKALFKRESDEAIEIYKQCKYPIHFLGLADDSPFIDLNKVDKIVRSCDTSQLVTMIKNDGEDVLNWTRPSQSEVIDLLNDNIDPKRTREVARLIRQYFNK